MKRRLFFLVALVFSIIAADAQLFKFTFDGSYPSQINAVSVQNADVTPVTRSTGINLTSGDEVYNTSGWNLSAQGAQYLAITITAQPGYLVRIQSIGVSAWSTFTGPSNAKISVEKSSAEVAAYPFTPGKAATSGASAPSSLPAFYYDLSSTPVSSDINGSITIKIYGWGNATGGNMRIDNLYVNGVLLTDGPLSFDYVNKRVGINVTSTLNETLEVNGRVKATGLLIPSSAPAGFVLTTDGSGLASWLAPTGGTGTSPWYSSANGFNISNTNTGSVYIGMTATEAPVASNDAYKLYVKKGIRTEKLKVDHSAWPDFVFDKEYQLPSLIEVEQFIKNNKHLEGIKSAEEVKKDGVDVGDNQAAMLQKIEELTLYIIEQNKKIIEQGRQLTNLQQQVDQLRSLSGGRQ
jgi:hypothetical protein